MSEKIKTAVMKIIKAHMDGEDKNTKAVLSDVMKSVRETLEQEPCDECRNKRTSFCGNCKEYDEFEPCDDAISRDAVMNEVKCWIGSGEYRYTNATDYLSKRIRELPTVNPQPSEHFIDGVHAMGYREGYKDAQKQKSGKWIPVSERLPEVGISVLVSDADSDIYFTHITRDGVFFDEWGNKIKGIVAWMPLPEPYKTESEVEE